MPEGKKPRSIFTTETVLADKGTTSTGSNDVFEYFKKDVFSNPKPVALLRFLLGFGALNDDIILDFFSGSGTIAEAVFLANAAESNGKRKFIAVQINEDIDAMLASSSANAKRVAENAVDVLDELGKPHYITELAKERIRRAGAKIKEKSDVPKNDLDIGFRVLKLDDTNMKDVYYAAGEYTQDLLSGMESNIKEDRTDLDLLFGCLLDWGLPLSLPHTQEKIDGVTVHTYNGGDLIACFADNVSEKVVKEIAKRQPLRAVFRDSSFSNSPRKINVDEIFKLLAPKTTVKVL
jgi:adenine-specific DNA-methyltransferase